MSIDYLDPVNIIVLEALEELDVKWEKTSKNWLPVFKISLKRFFFFPLADEKWTYWVFFQPSSIWPSRISPKETYLLKIAKLVSHYNPKRVYIDRGYGIDPEKPDRVYSDEETVLGLRLWTKAFESKIFIYMIKDYEKVRKAAMKRIIKECPTYFNEPCSEEDARKVFDNRVMSIALRGSAPMKPYGESILKILPTVYRG